MEGMFSEPLRRVEELVSTPIDMGRADKAGRMLDATMETIALNAGNVTRGELVKGYETAVAALRRIGANHGIDRSSPAFLAGRLASAADIFGYAAEVTAGDELEALMDFPRNAAVIRALADGRETAPDIAAATGLEEGVVMAVLGELCCASAVSMFGAWIGRVYVLTPSGRLLLPDEPRTPRGM
jgi:hypothetical protein